jgi:hypothetical protein
MAERDIRVPTVVVGDTWSDDDIQLIERTSTVQVGEPWTQDDLEVSSEDNLQLSRTRVATAFAVLFGVLVVFVAVYSMCVHDASMVERVWQFATKGVFVVLAWACGSHILKIVSGIRFNERDEQHQTQANKNTASP